MDRLEVSLAEAVTAERDGGGSPGGPEQVTVGIGRFRLHAWAVHVVLPLLVGGLIYLLWRPQTLLLFRWLGGVGLDGITGRVRDVLSGGYSWLPEWSLYSAPAGLWSYSLSAALVLIWRQQAGRDRRAWLGVALLIPLGSELGQLLGAVPGAFDLNDVVAYLAGWTLGVSLTERSLANASKEPFLHVSSGRGTDLRFRDG